MEGRYGDGMTSVQTPRNQSDNVGPLDHAGNTGGVAPQQSAFSHQYSGQMPADNTYGNNNYSNTGNEYSTGMNEKTMLDRQEAQPDEKMGTIGVTEAEEVYQARAAIHEGEYSGLLGMIHNPFTAATAIFASLGGLLFGYDQGVISGVLVMQFFEAKFPLSASDKGFIVAILELGCWFGALCCGYLADRLSRKYTIVMASCIFLVGTALQTGAQSRSYLYAGRFIAGLSIGSLSMVVPLYQSEISPPSIRGSLVALQQFAITVGILISFWIDFGTNTIQSDTQWRLPLGLQLILGAILALGILFFPHSPRWLMAQGRDDEAARVLSKLRRKPVDSPLVVAEWSEIKAVVEFDKEVARRDFPQYADGSGRSNFMLGLMRYRELFRPGIFPRLCIGVLVNFFQQFTGINAVIYYAPTIFQSIGLSGTSTSLLATGVVGIINVVFTIPAVLFLDVIGRRPLLLGAAVMLTISHVIIAIMIGLYSSDWPAHAAQGWVAVAFIYVYIASFACSWGPIGWVLPSEIFPLRVRAKGISISASSNWMNNFIIALITPPMLQAWNWGAYVFFAAFCFLAFFWVLIFVPETKGRTLEEMDEVFGSKAGTVDVQLMQRIEGDIIRRRRSSFVQV
ncbi:hypothetical protein BZG36_01380 [Bifiguratus adelaidae]|uniref:Major facilitator superfamily (MFS) profile domain-containing protein n=1 Tax=Bifiguratus adelaidae TaxID=1938954 RepID=A0A261Y3D1_9FUNG|nr:hypothetical protein BZG36_01380 [Bifiguratus adelaidae]